MADPHETCTGMSRLHVHTLIESSIFTRFSESHKRSPQMASKRSVSKSMRQNDPQSAPPGSPKRDPNPSTLGRTSLELVRGRVHYPSPLTPLPWTPFRPNGKKHDKIRAFNKTCAFRASPEGSSIALGDMCFDFLH